MAANVAMVQATSCPAKRWAPVTRWMNSGSSTVRRLPFATGARRCGRASHRHADRPASTLADRPTPMAMATSLAPRTVVLTSVLNRGGRLADRSPMRFRSLASTLRIARNQITGPL
jgi:hypothetical protein